MSDVPPPDAAVHGGGGVRHPRRPGVRRRYHQAVDPRPGRRGLQLALPRRQGCGRGARRRRGGAGHRVRPPGPAAQRAGRVGRSRLGSATSGAPWASLQSPRAVRSTPREPCGRHRTQRHRRGAGRTRPSTGATGAVSMVRALHGAGTTQRPTTSSVCTTRRRLRRHGGGDGALVGAVVERRRVVQPEGEAVVGRCGAGHLRRPVERPDHRHRAGRTRVGVRPPARGGDAAFGVDRAAHVASTGPPAGTAGPRAAPPRR